MVEWYVENLRDCQAWKAEGIQISTSSNEAARLFDALLRQYVSWSELMSRVISLGLEAMGTGRSIRLDQNYQNDLEQLLKDAFKYGTVYEKNHAKAIHMFAN
ncbi:unnamed protein product, partial [Onchocerca ochengi]|uniref:Oxidoreductase n=1 Tax=Onchocerca ochengi TaxID=42157 RepID=A0A182ENG0_ONCOC